MKKRNHLLEK